MNPPVEYQIRKNISESAKLKVGGLFVIRLSAVSPAILIKFSLLQY